MEEKIKARYIDPMVDWSFKRLFGSEVNKNLSRIQISESSRAD